MIDAGKALASTVIDLLANDGSKAKEIIADFDAPLSRDNYLKTLRGFQRTEVWDGK